MHELAFQHPRYGALKIRLDWNSKYITYFFRGETKNLYYLDFIKFLNVEFNYQADMFWKEVEQKLQLLTKRLEIDYNYHYNSESGFNLYSNYQNRVSEQDSIYNNQKKEMEWDVQKSLLELQKLEIKVIDNKNKLKLLLI